MTPLDVLNDAPAGRAGAIDQTGAGLDAQPPTVSAGVTVSSDCSSTVCGCGVTTTATVPGVSVTWMLNALLEPASPRAAVAVSVNGPYVPPAPPSAAAQSGVHEMTPLEVLNEAPAGRA